ncbi:hypothetical protein [Pseudomonas siliginis]|uniref:hypothetical protein n=1 Tax=Pseudomonas siliginis TaxID=2842346 RepID=UPI001C3C245E|nr:hypothetical protein [Pseudomonas siliginis]MBV4471486.1 hypothetical protein [Pseudomonas siliginis]
MKTRNSQTNGDVVTPAKSHIKFTRLKEQHKFVQVEHVRYASGNGGESIAFVGRLDNTYFVVSLPVNPQEGKHEYRIYEDYPENYSIFGYFFGNNGSQSYEVHTNGTLNLTLSTDMKKASGTFKFTDVDNESVTGDFDIAW